MKSKLSITLFLFFFWATNAQSQQLNWTLRAGSGSYDQGNTVWTDGAGNVIMGGSFQGTVDFDPSPATVNLTSAGDYDIVLNKYNTAGALTWAIRIGGLQRDNVQAVTTDGANNIIVTGYFRGTADFDPSPAVFNLVSNGDGGSDPGYGGDIFVAKYSPTGQLLWAFNAGGVELYDSGNAIAADNNGNIYIGGYFKGIADFNPGAGTNTLSSVNGTFFLAKYDAAGNYQWAFNSGQGDVDNTIVDLKTDINGNVYIGGFFQGTNIDFDPSPAGTALLSSNGNFEAFFAKYTTNGAYVFAHKIGGNGLDVIRGLDLDNSGNIYVIGDFNNTNVDFDPSAAGTAILNSNGGSDIFLASYTNAGNYRWAVNFGSSGNDLGWHVSTESSHLFITGWFTNTTDMNPGPAVDNLVSAGGDDIYLSKFSLSGEYICSFRIGGSGTDYGVGLKATGSNSFYLTGAFSGVNVDFDPQPSTLNLSSAGSGDIYLARYDWPDNLMPAGTLNGGNICQGQPAQLVFNATSGTGPFTIVYNNGSGNITVNNVQSGVPFTVTPAPVATTTYTLVSIKDAARCAETRFVSGISATINVQVCADTIINNYTPVLALDPCKNILTVEDGTAYNAGDTVLLIQMKGAVVDSSNSPAFGIVQDYKSAGNYEFNYVKSRTGNQVELLNQLTRTYQIPDGKVQLIRVPYYTNYTATQPVTALPWDGRKGGVVVMNVRDTLNLQSNIDVTGKGFAGGKVINSNLNSTNCQQNQYYYPTPSTLAAPKGESITTLSSNRTSGKGMLASGGGGGLDHNSGGGGGGNASTGGFGGYQLFECINAIFDNRGIGGQGLLYTNALNKIYLGGGGGAGHCNNGFVAPASNTNFDGGRGGGIIIVKADVLRGFNNQIISKGDSAYELNSNGGETHDGMGGGGAGGTVLLSVNNYLTTTNIDISGGKGGDMHATLAGGRIGPGGGGAGGVLWLKQASLPASLSVINSGGRNGYLLQGGNAPHGATAGQSGQSFYNLQLAESAVLFIRNIDSVRIKDSLLTCNSFDFKGLVYTNTNPVTSWQWSFGDNTSATTQNAQHTYTAPGTYQVKLVVTEQNGCKDSITTNVTASLLSFDFNYRQDVCNPLSVQFNGAGSSNGSPYWAFGDNTSATGSLNPVHVYGTPGNYLVQYSVSNGSCRDTLRKTITVGITDDNIILTNDTTICPGTTKKLKTVPSLSFCWTPATYLDNPNSPEPTTSTPQDITYYYTAEVTGVNLITNGNFSAGNSGFTSAYNFAANNTTEGQYFVGTSPQAWNPSLSNCGDHTSGNGNMLLVNGSPVANVNVWSQTINVSPNTNYAFSTWIQALWPPNPAQLQFAINGRDLGSPITASLPTCTWTQFYTTWNSGANTTATISIVNKNTQIQGNDFALDDISFAPVFVKRDSVKIFVDSPAVRTNADTLICEGAAVQLNATGALSYAWMPAGSLSNAGIPNPVATPNTNTQYIVTGINGFGCTATDTVNIAVTSKPVITITSDTAICNNSSLQLLASGGNSYQWSPGGSLSDTNVPNPVATPVVNTTYYVQVTNAANCTNTDSVRVNIRPAAQFSISPAAALCNGNSVQLNATGGSIYTWQPAGSLSNPTVANPLASPVTTTQYTVTITEPVCNESATLSTVITVNSLPVISAGKSNDIDCSRDNAQLTATGGSSYTWSPANTLSNATGATTVARPTVNTYYIVTGTDNNGCSNSDSVLVKVENINKGNFLMPTGFTPNNDGKNDCYGIKYWGTILELDFNIYNRWGQLVFHTNDPSKCWDGRFKGVPQDGNVFVYWIRAKTTCDANVFRKGSFVLIR